MFACVLACFGVNLRSARACEAVILWGILFLAGDCGWESVYVCEYVYLFLMKPLLNVPGSDSGKQGTMWST